MAVMPIGVMISPVRTIVTRIYQWWRRRKHQIDEINRRAVEPDHIRDTARPVAEGIIIIVSENHPIGNPFIIRQNIVKIGTPDFANEIPVGFRAKLDSDLITAIGLNVGNLIFNCSHIAADIGAFQIVRIGLIVSRGGQRYSQNTRDQNAKK
jgi:hypothetical protein